MSSIMQMTLIWLTVVGCITALTLARPNAGRVVIGLLFVISALGINLSFALLNPQGFVVLGQDSFLPLYRLLFTRVVARAPAFFGLVVVAYQLTLGLLVLGKHRAVKWGLAMGILFLAGTAPFMFWTLPNLVLAAALAWLLTKEFHVSLVEMMRARLRQQRA